MQCRESSLCNALNLIKSVLYLHYLLSILFVTNKVIEVEEEINLSSYLLLVRKFTAAADTYI